MTHGLVLGLIAEQAAELAVDDVLLGADELQRAGCNALGALGGVAHDEHRLAQARGLLLNAARVGEDEVARRHEVVEVENLERVDDMQAVETIELLVGRLADERVHVDGVDRLGVGVLLHHAANGAEHAVHGLAQVLAAVRRDEDEAGALRPGELGVGIPLAHGGAQGVDAGVSGDPDLRLRLALAEQVLLAGLRGGEVVLADDVHGLAVELLRPGAVDVVRAQAGLDMPHGDLQVEAGERRGEAGRGVAVDQDDVGLLVLEDGLELDKYVARHVEQRLARLHDRQIVVGSHVEDAQHLVEHLAVLARHGHDGLELILLRLQLIDERAHLDGLRAGAEDEHYLLQNGFPLKSHMVLQLVDVLAVAADVARVDEDAVTEDAGVVLDLGVADHHDHHLQAVQELLHGMHLAGDLVALDPRVVDLDGAGAEVLGHGLEHLQRRGLADVVDVLLVGEAVDADLGGVGDAALRHDLVGAVHDVLGHGGVGLKGEADEVGRLGVVADQEPRVDRDAVAADARAGVEDVHARVLVGDADDLGDVHAADSADLGELVGEGDVHRAEGVLDDLGHLGGADVGDGDLALAEAGVDLGHGLAHLGVVGADGAVVVKQLVDHVARDDALGGVDEPDVLAAGLCEQRANEAVDGVGRDGGLDDEYGALGRDLEDGLAGSHDVAGVDLLVELVVGRGDRDDVGVADLVVGGELDAGLQGVGEQLVQALLLEGGLAGVEGGDEFLVVVGANDLHSVGCHHEGGGQADVAETDNVNHCYSPFLANLYLYVRATNLRLPMM